MGFPEEAGAARDPSPAPDAGRGDRLLRARLRRFLSAAKDPVPGGERPPPEPAAPAVPSGGGLAVREERFAAGSCPPDLFGAGFDGDPGRGGPLAFLDLETCGLADDPIFLVGVLLPEGGELRLLRALARDPSAEPALLRWAAETVGPERTWVTFNGRSFDGPRLRRRAAHHGVDFPAPPGHRDLLLAVRRRWKASLPDCRLGTVERRLLGLERGPGDVPGREVPERYRDFLRTGDPRWIRPVLEHNRRDVTAMVVLHRRLCDAGDWMCG